MCTELPFNFLDEDMTNTLFINTTSTGKLPMQCCWLYKIANAKMNYESDYSVYVINKFVPLFHASDP